MRRLSGITAISLIALLTSSACRQQDQVSSTSTPGATSSRVARAHLPAGSAVEVVLNNTISSKSAAVGDSWTGTVKSDVVSDGRVLVSAGSAASGTVSGVHAAERGSRAMLDLRLTALTVEGRHQTVHGHTEAIVAGSTRARNLGAIAGSAAAGALIGKMVGGTGRSAAVGGVIGGAAATGVVAGSEGWQVELKPGTSISFTTDEPIASF